MRRVWRMAAIGGSVVAVGALALVFRTLNAAGQFSDLTPGYAGVCRTVGGVTGASDIALDRPSGLAFVAVADRRAGAPQGRDGLYVLEPAHPERGLTRLAGTPGDFHPIGVSLFPGPGGRLTVMAVNLRSKGGASIDIFRAAVRQAADGTPSVSLTEAGSVRSSALSHPRSVVAVGTDSFFATNAPPQRTSFASMLRASVLPGSGTVIYYNGQIPRIVANGLRGASGIATSHDGLRLYVDEMIGRDIRTYSVVPIVGALKQVNVYELPAGLDNIAVDADGNLWVAGHPKLFRYAAYAQNPSDRSPSEVFRVATVNGVPSSSSPIYTGLGARLAAASTAVYGDGRLLIGSRYDDRILDCTPR